MFDKELHISRLIAAYLQGRITESEQAALDNWLEEKPENREHFDTTFQEHILLDSLRVYETANRESVWKKTMDRINAGPKKFTDVPVRRLSVFKSVGIAAAVIMIVFGAGLLYYANKLSKSDDVLVYGTSIKPGKNGATLTLADGKKIYLSDALDGKIAEEGAITISKTAEGDLVYELKPGENIEGRVNILSTAKGETHSIILPDHSKVWLNAASRLTYSAALLKDGIRKVKLEGESYFEVSKDKAHPFVVATKHQDVTVLGTHFNINAYEDEENVKSTLLEGAVRVDLEEGGLSKVLRPGEQSVSDGRRILVREVDPETIVDWKGGYFIFKGEDFKTAMRKVARWYDVDIVYDSDVPTDIEPGGWISRRSDIRTILSRIEMTSGIHFKIEGRRITVTR